MLTVGAILKEPVETTLRFVSWYLSQGADRIILCFDDPDDPAIELLSPLNAVECIRCDEGFWHDINISPDKRFTRRQNKAMRHVYYTVKRGWFLNVDADELLHFDAGPVSEQLDLLPEETKSVLIRPAEHIQTPESRGTSHFRLAMRPWASRMLYGDLGQLMQSRAGLSGHVIGKSAYRAGVRGLLMGQHYPKLRSGKPLTNLRLGRPEGANILHFFDQGFARWREKLEWRMGSWGYPTEFGAHLREILDGEDPDRGLLEVYDRLHVFDTERLDVLSKCYARLDLDLDLDGIVKQYFPAAPSKVRSVA